MFDLLFTVIMVLMLLLSIGALSPSTSAQETAAIKKKIKEYVRVIKQEKHGENYYLFDAETDMFVAQGKTDEEIKTVLKSRFPKHVFLLNDEYMMAGPDFNIVKIDHKILSKLEIK